MSILILRPNAIGVSQHTPEGDTPNWKCVDDVVSDGATTRVDNVGTGIRQDYYGLEDSSGQYGVINSVRVYMVVSGFTSGGQIAASTVIRTNGTTYVSSAEDITLVTLYTSYSTLYVTNPFTGLAWSWAEVDALQAGVETDCDSATARCTQVYCEVDYVGSTHIPVTARYSVPGTITNTSVTGSVVRYSCQDIPAQIARVESPITITAVAGPEAIEEIV